MTRDALAELLCRHVCPQGIDHTHAAREPRCGMVADAVLASGTLPDATQIRAQAYRDAASIVETFEDGPAAAKALAFLADRS